MLKEYYNEVKKVLQETTAISQKEQEEFVAGAEQYIADLENERYTILIAGKSCDCYIVVSERNDRTLITYRINITRHSVCNEKYWLKLISILTGETGAGKSSLINLLLNDNVLPTSIIQNTHTICEISYGQTKEAVIHFFNTSKPARVLNESKFDKIKRYIEKPVQNEPLCKRIEIKIPNPLLKVQNKICLHQNFRVKITYHFCRPEVKKHGHEN